MSTQEQNTPRLLPVEYINEAVRVANKKYPNAYHGNIFEFYGPQMLNIDFSYTDEVPEIGQMSPLYRLKMINGQWNLMV